MIKLIPGEVIEKITSKNPINKREVVLIYVIGGLTYGEVTCLRLLGKIYQKEVIIATTQMLNASKIFNFMIDK